MDFKYQLKKINISSISNNKHLGVSIQEQDIDRCVKTMQNYGLITPIVVGKIGEECDVILSGQCEINALRQMKVTQTDAIMIDCVDNTEANKLSLLISSLKQQPSAVVEGLLIREMVTSKDFKQKDVAHLIGKSESWVAKRISLVQKLSNPVIDMVINKHLCSRSAEEIARLPEEVQANFAHKTVAFNIPKSKVEQLVLMYNNPSVSPSIKKIILENPQNTGDILTKKVKKTTAKIQRGHLEDSDSKRMSLIKTSISIIIRGIADVEANIHQVPKKRLQEQSSLLSSCINSSERFSKLLLAFTRESFPGESSGDNSLGGELR